MSDSSSQPGPLSRLWALVRWPVAIGLLTWLFHQNVYRHADDLTSRSVAWWAVAAAVVCFTSALLLTFLRWYLLVRAQGFTFSYGDAVRLGFVGMLFNFVAPGSVGGDVVKAAMIAKRQESRRIVAAATVFLDRGLGMYGLFVFGLITFALLPADYRSHVPWLGWLFATGVTAGSLGLVMALWPRVTNAGWVRATTQWRYVGRFIGGALNAVKLYQEKWRVIAASVLISVVGHLGIISTFYLCSLALARGTVVPSYGTQIVFGAGSNFIQAFVPTPGGTGAFETAYAASFRVADGVRVDRVQAANTGTAPPEWRSALNAVRGPGGTDERAAIVAAKSGPTAAQLDGGLAALTAVETSDQDAADAFGTGAHGLSATAFWAAYRGGRAELAFREGLLAALGYRVLTVLVALVGAVFYFASRGEFDSAMTEEAATGDEPNVAEERGPDAAPPTSSPTDGVHGTVPMNRP